MSRKWWHPKNPKPGFLGILHTIKNIPTEALRSLLTAIHFNPDIKGKDLAHRLTEALLGALAVWMIYEVINFHPVTG